MATWHGSKPRDMSYRKTGRQIDRLIYGGIDRQGDREREGERERETERGRGRERDREIER